MSRNLGALTLLDPSGPALPVIGVLVQWTVFGKYAFNMQCVLIFFTNPV
jgi:hypothetical protein